MKRTFAVLSLAAGALLWASGASATLYVITSSLDGAQETPPVITLGTGTMTGLYNDVTNALSWSGSFVSLTGLSTNAHFHGPAAPGVGPAGVRVGMTALPDIFPLGVTGGAFSGSEVLSATNETMLLAGLMYVNIHSTFQPLGEIRGQVYATVPEPAPLALLAVGFVGLAGVARRRG